MIKILTTANFQALIDAEFDVPDRAEVVRKVKTWTDRGDGAAVYRNEDFGSHGLGSLKIVSYGSPAAQLEVEVPPTTLPDIGGAINWRYLLVGVFGGPAAVVVLP